MMHRSVRSRESHNIRVSSRYPRAGHQHHHSILWPVAGAMFLSGGQSELEATLNLNAMNQQPNPWHVSFSYARALQNSVLKTWQGDSKNEEAAKKALLKRASANSNAQLGKYDPSTESEDVGEQLYEKGYKY